MSKKKAKTRRSEPDIILKLKHSDGIYRRRFTERNIQENEEHWKPFVESLEKVIVFEINGQIFNPTNFSDSLSNLADEINALRRSGWWELDLFIQCAFSELKRQRKLKEKLTFHHQIYRSVKCVHIFDAEKSRVIEPMIFSLPIARERFKVHPAWIDELIYLFFPTYCKMQEGYRIHMMENIFGVGREYTSKFEFCWEAINARDSEKKLVLVQEREEENSRREPPCVRIFPDKVSVELETFPEDLCKGNLNHDTRGKRLIYKGIMCEDKKNLLVDKLRSYQSSQKGYPSWKKAVETLFEKSQGEPILVSSPKFRKALEQLSEAWNDRHAKRNSIMVWAPPGSGKEILSTAFSLAWGADKKVNISAGGISDVSDIEKQFREGLVAYELVEGDEGQKTDFLKGKSGELVGNKTLIFVDEIDKASENVRSFFLRLLDPGILAPNTEVPKMWCFIFAGSAESKIKELSPIDFWTRMDYTVMMEHPFSIPDLAEQKEVIEHYVKFFWHAVSGDWRKEFRFTSPLLKKINDDLFQDAAEVLTGPLADRISIRHLNKAIRRIFPKVLEGLIQYNTKKKRDSKEMLRNILQQELHDVLSIYTSQTII